MKVFMIDMTKWEQIAAQQAHQRKKIAGRLGGKIAIVTGSAQGFGKGIAEELYREGAFVVIADLNEMVVAQWRKIDALERRLGELREEFDAAAMARNDGPEKPPPHY